MNESIQAELILLLNIDNVKAGEQIKILSICSSFMSSQNYVDELKKIIDNIFVENFNINSEISRLIFGILKLNEKCSYIKNVDHYRLKYVVYSVLYNYLLKNQLDFLNHLDIGNFRLLFCNAWDLVSIDIKKVLVEKVNCDFCCGLFGSKKKINVK